MTSPRLSLVQRVARAIVPGRMFAAIEAQSRQWMMECPDCGLARSVWALGGMRYKASGTPRRFARCPQCGKSGWHRIRRTGEP